MAKNFNNKRHNDLSRNLTSLRVNYMKELGEDVVRKGGRSSNDFSERAVFDLGKDFYGLKIQKYVGGFEDGSYSKTDLPYNQRIAYNIAETRFLYGKR